ncbi:MULTISPECIES: GDSL-type esterase/lipase family protein [unclassified Mucilaginibacter]|uniref:GDSL-type esterase/lipase family protein n=1 Tax=unclassified Mucilaginibacter TaxID=2617802 RepID=UPI002AC9EB39|nr:MULTISPECIES: GDSL-type esterase/lipase family protein [unclassified Mucilaginibacter]MEB0263423.1 GDSL-type esterase/lipase family protein [Mucilaginibacter sp. 10I4]MEB0280651.1 GDSL-type esterase/lipase family protein [Mucilaginibacter sp. 10B2]MEB0303009.1 GDSL-type esterase/lipase family protein [Mucilaginibacter sp. 5C4]WPX24267.1 GDSL-type esterase/lipase family protein [Mucilaginibacter sp. 5C4]
MKLIYLLPLLLLTNPAFAQEKADSAKETAVIKGDYRDDWADLRHYEAGNKTLPPATANDKRVVFLGSSIFEKWKELVPGYFSSNKNYIDRGISGQISPQLLLRFRQDVINRKAKAVIILAGSNDIAGTTGHVTNERIMDNIRSMTELAKANNIKVILCAYLPVFDYPWRKGLEPANKIIALNKLITAYAAANKLTLLDYFTPLVDNRNNGQRPELTLDGVHPNVAGYKIMAKVTDEAIAKAFHK